MDRRFKLLLYIIVLMLALQSCKNQIPVDGEYQTLEKISVQKKDEVEKINFNSTLHKLLPKSEAIVVAKISEKKQKGYQVITQAVLFSNKQSQVEKEIFVETGDASLEINQTYLFFLNRNNDSYCALVDDEGYIKVVHKKNASKNIVNPETLIKARKMAARNLVQVQNDINKLTKNVVLPSTFNFFSQLYLIVQHSDYVFIGEIVDIEQERQTTFFIKTGGVEEKINQVAHPISIRVKKAFKGNPGEKTKVLLSQIMFEMTINNETLESTAHSMKDMPSLIVGNEYMFFLVDSKAQKNSPYKFFINPTQGYVEIFNGEQTLPIPINPYFTESFYIEDFVSDIEAILAGKYIYQGSDEKPSQEKEEQSKIEDILLDLDESERE